VEAGGSLAHALTRKLSVRPRNTVCSIRFENMIVASVADLKDGAGWSCYYRHKFRAMGLKT
jgi:hypothetical protein